ncbi:MAG: choice-of-anchor tandem repeat GloVer-containing protein, partial [Terriglobia bacterium]
WGEMPLRKVRIYGPWVLTMVLLIVATGVPVARAQTYTDLFSFGGAHGDSPFYPQLLAQGRDGNLYGTAAFGNHGRGVAFRVTPDGTAKVLYDFDGVHGVNPNSGLTLGTDGSFYGTTSEDGSNGWGTIFKITPNGRLTVLYNSNETLGQPQAPPIQAGDGNFYGTTMKRAYDITPSGTLTTLALLPGKSDAPLVQATDGSFYGTTIDGGRGDTGTVFRMTPDGVLTVLYNFSGKSSEPRNPMAPLIQASDGSFYGTTYNGGSNQDGTVFQIIPRQVFTVLHDFLDPNYPNDGAVPSAGLLQASDGNFYGATYYGGTGAGVIFEITAAGAYSVVYVLDPSSGEYPASTPMQHTNGKIYGLTEAGGTDNYGVVYSLDLGLPPFVRLLPTIGKVGETIEFLGQGFTGDNRCFLQRNGRSLHSRVGHLSHGGRSERGHNRHGHSHYPRRPAEQQSAFPRNPVMLYRSFDTLAACARGPSRANDRRVANESRLRIYVPPSINSAPSGADGAALGYCQPVNLNEEFLWINGL